MSREFEFKDAKKPLTIKVTQEDIDGAKPGDSRNCVMSRAVRRQHRCFSIEMYRTVAYVRKTENSVPIRYQISESAKDVLVTFDASGRSHPITVTLMPPRWGISAARHRTSHAKTIRDRSKRKRDKELKSGGTGKRRAYTKPDPLTLWGVRNGRGQRPFGRVPRDV